jgi:hypothetical protein
MRLRILLASVVVAAVVLSAGVLPAAAQSVKVSFHGGKVDLSAQNATIRAILVEWARVGGTQLVNAERLTGAPLTMEFHDAYERQVLEALLRGASGYMLGPRVTPPPAGGSGFDRIVILATSNAPRPAAPPLTPTPSRPPSPLGLRRLPTPEETQEPELDDEPSSPNAPARPETPADLRRRLGQLLEEREENEADTADEPASPAGNPFGVVPGSARPGVVTPAPAPPRGATQPRPPAPAPNPQQ